MPGTATKHTAAGAKAFAEFFIKTIDWGYATTSSAYMRHYFLASCIQCSNAAKALDNARRMHDHYLGGRITVERVRSVARAAHAPAEFDVHLTLQITSGEVIDSHGSVKSADAAHDSYRQLLGVQWRQNRWLAVLGTQE